MTGIHITLHYEGDIDGVCDVLIEHSRPPGVILVTIKERDDNHGEAVSRCIETIATQVAVTMPSATMPEVRFVEHYPNDREDPFSEVTFTWGEDRVACHPQWRPLTADGYERLRAELGVP